MPFHRVNDSTIEPTVGSQTRKTCTAVGIPSMAASTSLSCGVSRLRRLRGPPTVRSATATGPPSTDEDAFLLILDGLEQAIDIVRLVDELLERRDHHRRSKVGSRIAVQE